jgi:hypothetical protein
LLREEGLSAEEEEDDDDPLVVADDNAEELPARDNLINLLSTSSASLEALIVCDHGFA